MVRPKNEEIIEEIIQNYYDREDGETTPSFVYIIMEYLVNISKRRAFWSLNKDILKINDSDYQYAVSIKEDTAYPCLHSPKTTKETSSIRRIQRRPMRRIEDIVCEDFGRYQMWSLLHETPNTPYPIPWIRRDEEEDTEISCLIALRYNISSTAYNVSRVWRRGSQTCCSGENLSNNGKDNKDKKKQKRSKTDKKREKSSQE
ncbi:hypothetical protein Tco_0286309 [Tanacetum coccineum]